MKTAPAIQGEWKLSIGLYCLVALHPDGSGHLCHVCQDQIKVLTQGFFMALMPGLHYRER